MLRAMGKRKGLASKDPSALFEFQPKVPCRFLVVFEVVSSIRWIA